MKQPKMCLIYVFGALAITSGVFSQDTTTLPPETRGKLQKTDSYSLMHRHLYTYTNSYIHTHTHTHTACWICPSLSLFLLTSLNRPVCSSGFVCEDTMLWRRRKRGGVEIQQFSACLKPCSLHTEQQFEGPRHLHLPPTEWRSDTNCISTPGM